MAAEIHTTRRRRMTWREVLTKERTAEQFKLKNEAARPSPTQFLQSKLLRTSLPSKFLKE